MKIEAIVGKTIKDAIFLQCELVSLIFTDDSILYIKQPSQSGDLKLILATTSKTQIIADNEEV